MKKIAGVGRAAATLAIGLLCGCSTKVVRVDMDSARLAMPAAEQGRKPLACAYWLKEVVDAREGRGESGGLGANAFNFKDADRVVREQLLGAGLGAEATDQAPGIGVRIVQLYLSQNLTTKIPVAVYQVKVGDEPAFVIRSQKASMNWNGSEDEAYAAYSRALVGVNQQLILRLNSLCRAR